MKSKYAWILLSFLLTLSAAAQCPNLKVQLEAEIQLAGHLKKLSPEQIIEQLEQDQAEGRQLKVYLPYLFADRYPLGNQYLICWSMLKGALEGEEKDFQEEAKAWKQCLAGLDEGKLKSALPACFR